jgi:hypothetical protein
MIDATDKWTVRPRRRSICAALAILCSLPGAAFPQALTRVIHVSVDGLRPDAVVSLGPAGCPAFHRLMIEGAFTLNARTDCDYTNTLPNHACQMTGRDVTGPDGHGISFNSDTGGTIEEAHGSYVAGVFDVAHDHGHFTALFTGKSKFALFERSWDQVNGAPDLTDEDDGRDKIDRYLCLGNTSDLVDSFLSLIGGAAPGYYLLHLRDPDTDGHAYGWESPEYQAAVMRMDRYIGAILDAVKGDPALAASTAVTVTADHGGTGSGHDDASEPHNYTIQLHAWGPGIPSGADVYGLNPASRLDPGPDRPPCDSTVPPVRNGESANLALSLLGLPPVPGSTIGKPQGLAVTAPAALPSVTITSPPDGSAYRHGDPITIEAEATGGAGVSGVEFFIGWEKVCEDASPPYSMTWWDEQPLGVHAVAARAIGGDGFCATGMIRVEITSTSSDEALGLSGWDTPRVFPNPAGASPKILLHMPAPGAVEMTLYDVSGRERGKQLFHPPAGGLQALELDVSGYASGVYFFRAVSGKTVQRGKFILVR